MENNKVGRFLGTRSRFDTAHVYTGERSVSALYLSIYNFFNLYAVFVANWRRFSAL